MMWQVRRSSRVTALSRGLPPCDLHEAFGVGLDLILGIKVSAAKTGCGRWQERLGAVDAHRILRKSGWTAWNAVLIPYVFDCIFPGVKATEVEHIELPFAFR